jgi:coenzyme F420-reducing hydrogenase beta subunit
MKLYNLPDKSLCYGCKACVSICGQNALSMQEDVEGFVYPCLDVEKCVNCGRCYKVCPVLKNQFKPKRQYTRKGIAVRSNEYAPKSASGGVFALTANKVLSNDGYVAGAIFNEEWKVNHIVSNTIADINKMRGSKYLQSDICNSYTETKALLDKGKYVLFSGTPCQIAGLYGFLSKDYDKLFTIDLICHGVSSPMIWKNFLQEVAKNKKIKSIVFRNKSINLKNKIPHLDNNKEYFTIEYYDYDYYYDYWESTDFIKAFLNNLSLRPSCSNCQFAGRIRPGDITIGDLWTEEAAEDRKQGISQILINSKKGGDFLSSIKNDWSKKYVVNLNPPNANNINGHKPIHHIFRKRFFDLAKTKSIKEALDCSLNKKYDIAILCMHGSNYGNQLTSYAMYQIITDLGKTVLLIDRPLSSELKPSGTPYFLFKNLPIPNYSISQIFPNKASMFELNDRIGVFLLPSDQVLRPSYITVLDKYTLLDWVYDYKPKIAYSSSFGDEHFEGTDNLRAEIGFYLNRFNAISVREDSGVKYAKQYFDINVEQVLDPVFLLDFNLYKNMILKNNKRLPKNYLGGYILDPTQERVDIIRNIQKYLSLNNNCIITDAKRTIKNSRSLCDIDFLENVYIEEFLACIYHSDYFITDSFHGICFSIIFQKQFIIIYDDSQNRGFARINDILETFNLKNRLVTTFDEIINRNIFQNNINYDDVYAILNSEISRSKAWLSNVFYNISFYSGNKSSFDILNEKYQNLNEKYQEVINNYNHLLHVLNNKYFRKIYRIIKKLINLIR